MKHDPKKNKERLDKTLKDIEQFQQTLKNLTPEQREKLAEKVRENAPALRDLKERLENAAALFKDRKGSIPDRIAKQIASTSNEVPGLRKVKMKRDLVDDWGSGWLIPTSYSGKRASLKAGRSFDKFWESVIEARPHQKETLQATYLGWKKAPEKALPAIVQELARAVVQAAEGKESETNLPVELAGKILRRTVVEVQIQSGVDPSNVKGLEKMITALKRAEQGTSVPADARTLGLQGLIAIGWVVLGFSV